SRVPARRACASPARLSARDRRPVDGAGRSRRHDAAQSSARARQRRQDRGFALARARSADRAGRVKTRGGLMTPAISQRASRFVGAGDRIRVSFEFFPPKSEEMERTLWESIERLKPLAPNFVSVTYGAGGSTRERTHSTVKRILAETELVPAAHLTCVAATKAEIDAVIDGYVPSGVRPSGAPRAQPV